QQMIVAGNTDTHTSLYLNPEKVARQRTPWLSSRDRYPDGTPREFCGVSAVSPDGAVIAYGIMRRSLGSPIRLVDAASGKLLREVPSDRFYHRLIFLNEGRTLAAVNTDAVRLINVADGKDIRIG